MLGDESRYPGLFDDAIVESDEVGVGVDDGGGDADEVSVPQLIQPVCDQDVSHAHLTVCAFGERSRSRRRGRKNVSYNATESSAGEKQRTSSRPHGTGQGGILASYHESAEQSTQGLGAIATRFTGCPPADRKERQIPYMSHERARAFGADRPAVNLFKRRTLS